MNSARLWKGYPTYWAYQAVGWGGWWTFGSQPSVTERPFTLEILFHNFWVNLAAIGLTHFYRVLIDRWNWKARRWGGLLPRVLLASMVLSGLHSLLVWPLLPVDQSLDLTHLAWWSEYLVTSVGSSMLFLGWSAIYFGYHHQQALADLQVRQSQLEAAANEAALAALRMQVNPHFLFNSLNTLRALIDENPEKASEAVTQLARVFRASLLSASTPLVPLSEELETVQAYLDLEQLRLEERLTVCADVAPDTLDQKLPPFLLQTLIENAVKYGIAPREDGGVVTYATQIQNHEFLLTVTNPGRLAKVSRSTGVGLKNARKRLELLFGGGAHLEVVDAEGPRVIATVRLPCTPL